MHLRYFTLQSHLDKVQLASLYVLAGDEQLLLLEAADLIRKTAMRFVIFCLVYWSLLRRGNLTIFTKYFLYGV